MCNTQRREERRESGREGGKGRERALLKLQLLIKEVWSSSHPWLNHITVMVAAGEGGFQAKSAGPEPFHLYGWDGSRPPCQVIEQ